MLLKITFKDGDVVNLQGFLNVAFVKHPMCGDDIYISIRSGMEVVYPAEDVQEIIIGA